MEKMTSVDKNSFTPLNDKKSQKESASTRTTKPNLVLFIVCFLSLSLPKIDNRVV